MNSVQLIGRLTKDPEIRYTTGSQTALVNFVLAVNRPGKEQADFPRIKIFGRVAEIVNQYCYKGQKIAVEGRIETGSYEGKNGTVYTTDIVANKVEFLERKEHAGGWSGGHEPQYAESRPQTEPAQSGGYQSRSYPGQQEERQMNMAEMPDDFEELDEDTPF